MMMQKPTTTDTAARASSSAPARPPLRTAVAAAAAPRARADATRAPAAQHALRRASALLVAHAAAATKGGGFGASQPGKAPAEGGCPCGSGLLYKNCCKPHHQPRAPPPETVEATVRARFSAVVKREMPFLLRTFHPNFHAIQYGTEPGGAAQKLEDDMWRTCKEFKVSNLKILNIAEDAEKPGEWLCEMQYYTENLRAPELDGNGNKRRLVRMERDRFVRGDESAGGGKGAGGYWQLCDYQLADVPESLVKAAERAKAEGKELPPLEKRAGGGDEEGARATEGEGQQAAAA
jgi:hypothetical protein